MTGGVYNIGKGLLAYLERKSYFARERAQTGVESDVVLDELLTLQSEGRKKP